MEIQNPIILRIAFDESVKNDLNVDEMLLVELIQFIKSTPVLSCQAASSVMQRLYSIAYYDPYVDLELRKEAVKLASAIVTVIASGLSGEERDQFKKVVNNFVKEGEAISKTLGINWS